MKKIILFVFFILTITQTGFSIPVHLIGGQFGISMPGEKEITDIFTSISPNISIYSYNVGIEYNFRFVPYLSIGAGCNYLFKSYIVDFTIDQISFNYNAIEPYGIIRGYLQIMNGIDLFASAGVGYALLAGSKIVDNLTNSSSEVNGSGLSLKFSGGFTYEGSGFITMLEGGYKIATVSPLNATGDLYTSEIKNADGSSAIVNFGGPFVNILVFLGFGSHKQETSDNEIKEQTKKEISELKTEENSKEQTYQEQEKTKETQEKQISVSKEEIQEQKQIAETAVDSAQDKTYETIQEDDTEGIIILSPGESETAELEKYIASKRKQTIAEEKEETKEGEEIEFEYDIDKAGILLVEAETKGKVEKAGYILVERAGFITNNFTEDGYIFTKEKEKLFLTTPNFAYIRLIVGKGAKKGKEFIIYDDSEEILDNISGQPMGKLIKILGVAKVVGPAEDNIFKVQITKSYDLIKPEMKIKVRNDIKDYHRALSKKIKKKNLDVEGYIVKVLNNVTGIKNKDIVYLNIGVVKGILPGEKLDIYRRITDPKENKEEKFHKIGSLLIINSVQYSSVGLITEQNEIINIGDIVKTK
jgi:hypothetical protein